MRRAGFPFLSYGVDFSRFYIVAPPFFRRQDFEGCEGLPDPGRSSKPTKFRRLVVNLKTAKAASALTVPPFRARAPLTR